MSNEFSVETDEKIEKLCRSVRVSPAHDPEIHRELIAHLHDKLRGYLSGTEKISETDALLLVERHFGDFAAVREKLQDVHAPTHTWLRRLAAVVTVSALYPLPWIIYCALTGAVQKYDFLDDWNDGRFGGIVLSFLVCWMVLFAWNRNSEGGSTPWFMRWSRRTILCVVTAALVPYFAKYLLVADSRWDIPIQWKLLAVWFAGPDISFPDGIFIHSARLLYQFWHASGVYGTETLTATMEGVLWIWWLNRGRDTEASHFARIGMAALAWGIFQIVRSGVNEGLEVLSPLVVYLLFSWALLPMSSRALRLAPSRRSSPV
jgi:hypothetical protein